MGTAKKLALIAAGYALCVVAGFAAVAVNELRILAEAPDASSGMVAFGDMILFVMVVGFFGLVPTWFLLKLFAEKAPRSLVALELLFAALGPVCWLWVTYMGRSASLPNIPAAATEPFVLFIAFVSFPRMALGPPFLVIQAATFLLIRSRVMRMLLAVAMLMDLVPLSIFALNVARASHY